MEKELMPHIHLRHTQRGVERAFINGTRIRVSYIVSDHERHGLTPDEIARQYQHISLAQVHAALSYYFDNRELVRKHMKHDEEFVESTKAHFTHSNQEADGTDTKSDTISS